MNLESRSQRLAGDSRSSSVLPRPLLCSKLCSEDCIILGSGGGGPGRGGSLRQAHRLPGTQCASSAPSSALYLNALLKSSPYPAYPTFLLSREYTPGRVEVTNLPSCQLLSPSRAWAVVWEQSLLCGHGPITEESSLVPGTHLCRAGARMSSCSETGLARCLPWTGDRLPRQLLKLLSSLVLMP